MHKIATNRGILDDDFYVWLFSNDKKTQRANEEESIRSNFIAELPLAIDLTDERWSCCVEKIITNDEQDDRLYLDLKSSSHHHQVEMRKGHYRSLIELFDELWRVVSTVPPQIDLNPSLHRFTVILLDSIRGTTICYLPNPRPLSLVVLKNETIGSILQKMCTLYENDCEKNKVSDWAGVRVDKKKLATHVLKNRGADSKIRTEDGKHTLEVYGWRPEPFISLTGSPKNGFVLRSSYRRFYGLLNLPVMIAVDFSLGKLLQTDSSSSVARLKKGVISESGVSSEDLVSYLEWDAMPANIPPSYTSANAVHHTWPMFSKSTTSSKFVLTSKYDKVSVKSRRYPDLSLEIGNNYTHTFDELLTLSKNDPDPIQKHRTTHVDVELVGFDTERKDVSNRGLETFLFAASVPLFTYTRGKKRNRLQRIAEKSFESKRHGKSLLLKKKFDKIHVRITDSKTHKTVPQWRGMTMLSLKFVQDSAVFSLHND